MGMIRRFLPLLAALAGCTATANAQVQLNNEATAPVEGPKYPDPVEKATPNTVAIHCEPSSVGEIRHVRVESEVTLHRPGLTTTVRAVSDMRRKILAVKAKEITKVEVAVLAESVSVSQGKKGKEKVTQGSLVGRTFIITAAGGLQPVVTTDAGAPVSPFVAAKIAPSFRSLGNTAANCPYPATPMKIGQGLPTTYSGPLYSDTIFTTLKAESSAYLSEIKKPGEEDAIAVFTTASNERVELTSGLRLNLEGKGTMSVRAIDARLLGWKMTGTVSADPDGQGQVGGTYWIVGTVTEE